MVSPHPPGTTVTLIRDLPLSVFWVPMSSCCCCCLSCCCQKFSWELGHQRMKIRETQETFSHFLYVKGLVPTLKPELNCCSLSSLWTLVLTLSFQQLLSGSFRLLEGNEKKNTKMIIHHWPSAVQNSALLPQPTCHIHFSESSRCCSKPSLQVLQLHSVGMFTSYPEPDPNLFSLLYLSEPFLLCNLVILCIIFSVFVLEQDRKKNGKEERKDDMEGG